MKKFIKRIVPAKLIAILNKSRESIDHSLVDMASKSKTLSSLYYLLVSRAFRREQQAVLYGRSRYYRESHLKQNTQYLLRRNIHGLEKGLLMRPRRDIFGLDYLEETINSYEKALAEPGLSSSSELQWAHDILEEYFKVVSPHPIIGKAKARFESSIGNLEPGCQLIPYKRNKDPHPLISYEQLLDLAHRRKSVRWYLQKPVPRELIDKAISLASLSPSACNRQPFTFRVFDDPDLIQKVSSLPGGTRGFYQNLPVVVAIVGNLRAYFNERDRHLIYIDASLASMAFMFALETLGLSSCGLNWPDIDRIENSITKILGLEPDERVILLIALGYADSEGMVAYSQKKDLDILRSYNV
jgi:nitroreductase